jgi:hypothetical protein
MGEADERSEFDVLSKAGLRSGQAYWPNIGASLTRRLFYLYRYHEYVRKSFDEMGIQPFRMPSV